MVEAKPEEKKRFEVPDWAVKLVLGGAAIGVAGYVAYYFLSGGAAAEAAKKEITDWTNEYARELKKITDERRVPTQAEEYALKAKAERIEAAYGKLHVIYDKAVAFLIAAVGAAATVWLISRLAKDYWQTHVKEVKTPYAAVHLLREAIAIDLHAAGQTTLAVALHTQTQTMFQTLYTPMMQSEVAYLTSVLPTLTGTRLLMAQFLIQSLQLEMAVIIPSIMAAASAILATPPPIILTKQ